MEIFSLKKMLNRSGDWGLRRTVLWAAGRCEEAAQKLSGANLRMAVAAAHNVMDDKIQKLKYKRKDLFAL
jgi:pyrroline-5-carboxylate reductase